MGRADADAETATDWAAGEFAATEPNAEPEVNRTPEGLEDCTNCFEASVAAVEEATEGAEVAGDDILGCDVVGAVPAAELS